MTHPEVILNPAWLRVEKSVRSQGLHRHSTIFSLTANLLTCKTPKLSSMSAFGHIVSIDFRIPSIAGGSVQPLQVSKFSPHSLCSPCGAMIPALWYLCCLWILHGVHFGVASGNESMVDGDTVCRSAGGSICPLRPRSQGADLLQRRVEVSEAFQLQPKLQSFRSFRSRSWFDFLTPPASAKGNVWFLQGRGCFWTPPGKWRPWPFMARWSGIGAKTTWSCVPITFWWRMVVTLSWAL